MVARLLAVILGLTLWPAGEARAQAAVAGRPFATCMMAHNTAGPSPVRLLREGGAFDCVRSQRSFGPGDFLIRSEPVSIAPGERVRMASVWQQRTDLYLLYADGAVRRLRGTGVDQTRRIQLGAMIEYRLPDRGIPVTRLLWDARGATNLRGVVVGTSIVTADQSLGWNLTIGALYAAFAGLCVALLTYNVALWAVLRYRFQLTYCAMVVALLAYAFSSSGALAWMAPDMSNTFRMRINYLTLGASATAALAFARGYLGPRVFAGWLGRAAAGVGVMIPVAALLFALLAPWQAQLLDRLYAVSFVGLVLVVLPVIARAWKVHGREAWLFTLAWATPIALATLRTAGNFGLVGWHFWLDHSTVFAMAAEALLSSLAVAHRLLGLVRERDEARAAEAEAWALADADPLTGLMNRRAFLTRAIGRDGLQTLLIVDVDHFKQVNDAIGHDGGDQVLRVVARAIRAAVPAEALVARIGGEEFAVLAGEATGLDPRRVLDTLRSRAMPYDLTVTASIGACTGPIASESEWKSLYRLADNALYEAKADGRDRARRVLAPNLMRAA